MFLDVFIEEKNLKVWSQMAQNQKVNKETKYLFIYFFSRTRL